MDFINWAKNRTLPSALQSRRGWAEFFDYHRSNFPHIHQIEPTNHCPYSCLMCPRQKHMTRPKGYMDLQLFKKIIDEVTTYPEEVRNKEIELFHFGESLLHPEIAQMLSNMLKHNLKPTLSLNPGELSPSLIEQLAESPPYKIIISIDSLDSDTYKYLRGKRADLDSAITNTRSLLKKFQQTGLETSIEVRMIVMHYNRDEANTYQRFWADSGAEIQLRNFFPWNSKKLSELGDVEKYPPYMPCPFPWQYLVVQWNGDVVACCRDYNGIQCLGNITEDSLEEIWNGAKARELREAMASGENMSAMCAECMEMYYSEP